MHFIVCFIRLLWHRLMLCHVTKQRILLPYVKIVSTPFQFTIEKSYLQYYGYNDFSLLLRHVENVYFVNRMWKIMIEKAVLIIYRCHPNYDWFKSNVCVFTYDFLVITTTTSKSLAVFMNKQSMSDYKYMITKKRKTRRQFLDGSSHTEMSH